jgi:hypothetical protein
MALDVTETKLNVPIGKLGLITLVNKEIVTGWRCVPRSLYQRNKK